jgi:hypothetical protein
MPLCFTIHVNIYDTCFFFFSLECVAKGRLISNLPFGWGEVGRSLLWPNVGGWVSRRCRSNYNRNTCAQSLQFTLTTH